jgi:DNA-binding GntR family transcriptional regulator
MKGGPDEIREIHIDPGGYENQSEQAYNLIEELIVTNVLPPGTLVSEAILSAKIGIGRSPVRMAVQYLEQQGLVNRLPRKGVFITQMHVEDELAILELRRPVERMLACKAARLATKAQRENLRFCADRMMQAAIAEDVHRFLHYDQECDRIIYGTSRNRFAIRFVQMLYAHSRRFWITHSRPDNWHTVAQFHLEMMNAVADGDEERVIKAFDSLIDYLEEFCKTVTGLV